jgi:hypothetical protein
MPNASASMRPSPTRVTTIGDRGVDVYLANPPNELLASGRQ